MPILHQDMKQEDNLFTSIWKITLNIPTKYQDKLEKLFIGRVIQIIIQIKSNKTNTFKI